MRRIDKRIVRRILVPAVLNIISDTMRIFQRLLLIKARNRRRVPLRTRLWRCGVELAVLGGNVRVGEEGEAGVDARGDAGCGQELAVLDPAGVFLPLDGRA